MEGSAQIKKIQEKKEKHTWAVQVMNQLLQCASMYEYDDNGGSPMGAKEEAEEEETQPYHFANGSVTFDDYNISGHPTHHLQPPTDSPQQPNMPSPEEINDGIQ